MAVPVQHVPTLRALDPDVIFVTGWVQLFNGYCALIRLPEEVPNAHGVIVPNERRRLFLQSVGDRAYEYLRTACLPNTPYSFPIHTLIRLLREKFEPPGLISTALQVLAARCEFGLHYPEALRDQLIAGVRSNELRLAMLRENNLTFFQAKELAVRDDALRSEVRLMAQHSMNVNVANSQAASGKPKNKGNFKKFTPSNKSNKKAQQPEASGSAPSWNPCFRCTRKHDGRTCPARNWECHKCKKKGHISKCCPKRQVQVVTAQPPDNAVVNTVGASLDDEVERLFRVSKESIQVICIDSVSQSPPVLVNVLINEKELEMEVDSGAGVSIVSSITYSKLFNSTPLSPSPYILTSVSGQIKVFGQLKVKVSLPSHAPVELILVVCEAVAPVRVQQLQSMFPSVFDLSNDQPITPFKAKLVFKENVKDIFAAAYSLPYAFVDVIDALINNLGYDFTIEHRKAELMSHVDALSRVPPVAEFFLDSSLNQRFSEALEISSISLDLPLSSSVIAEETKKDSELSKLVTQCKRSHDYVPWPDVKVPMQRVHIDFYAFKGLTFLLFADSFSKWLHIQRMEHTRAIDVITVLSTIFSIWGDPSSLVSDNGPPFDSVEFVDFLTSRDIVLIHSPAYHPESNGYAERSVQIAKKSLEK
ncbi:hypothetical protein KUF71_010135 [Frankliniella fusca]|uniref:Endonuclease n=1 Tax=Frankliniella fusca TaxID=407009 RepID=A0AAE1LII0_9NEOP|nr:hypothetical protein KUF71_010135 [Frankliniella fusca]